VSAQAAVARAGALQAHGRVMLAIMLRDVRTRMGSAPAFLIVVLWPLSHILALVALYSYGSRLPPVGDSMALWAATGVVSFMCFSYISRFSMLGIAQNKPLLGFPVVHPLHLLLARVVVQVLTSAAVILVIYALFYFLRIDSTPADPVGAAYGLLALVGMGVGFGLFFGVVGGIWPAFVTAYALFQIVLWFTSGIIFVPSNLPKGVIAWLKWHPILQGVEWVRSAYFLDYDTNVLNRTYAVGWAVGSIFAGLLAERMWRGKVLGN
jgi:capsular polysaccharide transport system permease protein